MLQPEGSNASSRGLSRSFRYAVAFIGAPLVGAIAGAVAVAWLVPGNAAMFGLMYALFGGCLAVVVTLVVGVPAYVLLAQRGVRLNPWLVVLAVTVGQLVAAAIPCMRSAADCGASPLHNHVFALVTSLVAGVLLVSLASELQ